MWQDYVLTAAQLVFCITLIPMLFTKGKPPLLSSVPTGILLLVMAFVYFTLTLWLAALSGTIVGLQWLALAVQKLLADRTPAD